MNPFRSLALALLALGLTGCHSSSAPSPVIAAQTQSAATASANTAPIDQAASTAEAATKFVAAGPIVVENQLDVVALREGVVAAILAQPGNHVQRGQLLAQLDDRQISADLDAAAAKTRSIEANLKNWQAETKVLQADLSRAEKLYAAQVIPQEELEHARYKEEADEFEVQRENESLNNARAVQQSLALEKEKTRIAAPFDGIVARRYVRVGQKVSAGDRLFWVTAMGPLQVRFTLAEKYLGKISSGMQVTVTPANVAGQPSYTAKVVQISPVVDPASGTIEVLAQVAASDGRLRPGMLVNISLNAQP